MNFKKIALALAIASSFGAHAELTLTDYQGSNAAVEGQETLYADFTSAATEGNTAYVFQQGGASGTTGGSLALVNQTDGANYAMVVQSGIGALAFVNQTGGGAQNKIMIMQVETGSTTRTTTLSDASVVATLAATELSTRSLSVGGNAVLAQQTAGDAANSGFVYQNGTNNFAALVQTGNVANFAYITQYASGSAALIKQQ